jgi:hypothetical protein
MPASVAFSKNAAVVLLALAPPGGKITLNVQNNEPCTAELPYIN